MDFSFTRADEEFRMQVRHFFETEYPQDLIEKMAHGHSPSKADYQRSERALDSKGWVAVNWPKEAGGTGWSSNQKYIFDEELERAGARSEEHTSELQSLMRISYAVSCLHKKNHH